MAHHCRYFFVFVVIATSFGWNRPARVMFLMKGFGSGSKPQSQIASGIPSTSSTRNNLKPSSPSHEALNRKPLLEDANSSSVALNIASSMQRHFPSLNLTFDGLRVLHIDPPVIEIPHFMSDAVCDDYISKAESQGYRIPSQTFGATAGSIRTSTTWYMNYAAVDSFINRVEQLLNWPRNRFEEPQIVRYEFGQQVRLW